MKASRGAGALLVGNFKRIAYLHGGGQGSGPDLGSWRTRATIYQLIGAVGVLSCVRHSCARNFTEDTHGIATASPAKLTVAVTTNVLLVMARAWARLADQAERNSRQDLVYETPSPRPDAR